MSKKYNQINSKHQPIKTNNLLILPFILILTLVPLITHSHNYDTKLADYPWFSHNGNFTDVFLYWKSIIFIIICTCVFWMLIYKFMYYKKELIVKPLFIPLFIYAFLSLLSSIVSKYAYFSFHGIYEQFESIWVILGYCIIVYYAFLVITSEENLIKIINWFLVGITLISLIGLSQALSFDFYKTTIGKLTYLPITSWDTMENIAFNFELGRVYSSLYNPNYIGSYVSLVAPILIMLIFFNKKLKYTTAYVLILISLFICLFASQSRSGLVAIFISFLLMALLLRKFIINKWKFVVLGTFLFIVSFFTINTMNNNILLNKIAGIFNNTEVQPPLQSIQTSDDKITITYKGEPLNVRFLADANTGSYIFELTDKNGTIVNSTPTGENYKVTINDSRFPSFSLYPISLNDYLCFSVNIDKTDWYFTNQTDGTYYYYTNTNKFDKIVQPETALFSKHQNFATTRGFIWARTIPLLKHNIIIGSGPDTFPLVFPNDDYVGKYNYGYSTKVITKPHNMYLQIGVQTGLLSLVAFLVFYLMYFILSIKLYFKHKLNTYASQIGVGILIGTVGYMITGLINDSTITVAPVFWTLIGIGVAINYRLINQNEI